MNADRASLDRWLQWPQSPTPEEVKAARKRASLSQTGAARCVHVLQRTWQKWEHGDNEMHPAFWELFLRKLIERECQVLEDAKEASKD